MTFFKRIKKWVFLAPLLMAGIALSSCSNDSGSNNSPSDNNADPDITKKETLAVFKKVLQDRGLVPKDLKTNKKQQNPTLADYISVSVTSEGFMEVNLNLNENGNIIHSKGWQQRNPGYCNDKKGSFKAPSKTLYFELSGDGDGGILATAKYRNLNNVNPAEDIAIRSGDNIEEAVNNAMDAITKPVKKAVDPCGEAVNYMVKLSTFTKQTATEDGKKTVITEEAQFKISLSYNKDKELYEGSGKLNWTLYQLNLPGSPTANCDTPGSAYVNVLLDAKQGFMNHRAIALSIEFYAKGQNLAQKTAPCEVTTSNGTIDSDGPLGLPNVWLQRHQGELDSIRYPANPDRDFGYFTMRAFKPAKNNPRLIGRKSYEGTKTRNTDNGTSKLEEITNVEIFRK